MIREIRSKSITPDATDYERVEREHGALPANATIEQQAERYRLAEACKLIRLYEQGKLPLAQMRELDKLRRKGAREWPKKK